MSCKTRFVRATNAARRKAIELGYLGLMDLDISGSGEHKAIVKNAFEKYAKRSDYDYF